EGIGETSRDIPLGRGSALKDRGILVVGIAARIRRCGEPEARSIPAARKDERIRVHELSGPFVALHAQRVWLDEQRGGRGDVLVVSSIEGHGELWLRRVGRGMAA